MKDEKSTTEHLKFMHNYTKNQLYSHNQNHS